MQRKHSTPDGTMQEKQSTSSGSTKKVFLNINISGDREKFKRHEHIRQPTKGLTTAHASTERLKVSAESSAPSINIEATSSSYTPKK